MIAWLRRSWRWIAGIGLALLALLAFVFRRRGAADDRAAGRAEERSRTAGQIARDAEARAEDLRREREAAPVEHAAADAADLQAARNVAAETRAAPPTPPRRENGVRAGRRPRSPIADQLGLGPPPHRAWCPRCDTIDPPPETRCPKAPEAATGREAFHELRFRSSRGPRWQ